MYRTLMNTQVGTRFRDTTTRVTTCLKNFSFGSGGIHSTRFGMPGMLVHITQLYYRIVLMRVCFIFFPAVFHPVCRISMRCAHGPGVFLAGLQDCRTCAGHGSSALGSAHRFAVQTMFSHLESSVHLLGLVSVREHHLPPPPLATGHWPHDPSSTSTST